ncbi:VOC family protein [Parerythrobacter aurantius]|uniref:VOC family protein n=1 Tax=Parerythrobacter aurantius TaxID=3127706 RepID=UPI00324A8A06
MRTANATDPIAALFEDLDPSQVKAIERPEPLLRAARLAYIRFEKPDLARQLRFLEDFGMSIARQSDSDLYMRGCGVDPFVYHARKGPKSRFVGVGFVVESHDDFERASRAAGASAILAEAGPGGGQKVILTDPNGFEVELIHGQTPTIPVTLRAPASVPNSTHAVGRPNLSVRPPLEPVQIMKLGHVVLQCCDFDATIDWWMRHLGLIPSDAQVLPDGSVNLAFCRLDLGNEPSDHHTVAIAGGVGAVYMHSAYEVRDIEAVGQGQQVLKAGGWRHGWGMGRHYYGSQIFDYWRDPWGDLMEHYADGDMFDAAVPTRYSRFSRGSTWMWGQDQPTDFEGVSPGLLLLALRNLVAGRISLARLKSVMASLKARPRPWLK